MSQPAALDAFDRLAARHGTATYVAVHPYAAITNHMGGVSSKVTQDAPLIPRAPYRTDDALEPSVPGSVPPQIRGNRSYRGAPPPVFIRGEISASNNTQGLAATRIDQAAPPRHIVVPDQAGLARSCSVGIQLLTFRCCIGNHADPQQVRFAICAGRRQGVWKSRIWRLPWSGDTAPFLQMFRKQWPLVAEIHWGISSREIVRRLVVSVGSEAAEIPGLDPEIDEWDAGARRFVSGQPHQLRLALEKESGFLDP